MSSTQQLLLGEGAGGPVTYIENVFSTWLTSGTGAGQSVVNGIDLATKGGLIWEKLRGPGTQSHSLTDTIRGLNSQLNTDTNGTGTTSSSCITAFNTNGFNFGTAYSNSGDTNVFWTFRKQPKFFDIVTYTGTGVARTISHSLGSVPGCIIVKRTDSTPYGWLTYHRGVNGGTNPQNYGLYLNATNAQGAASSFWNNTAPTSTQFTVGTDTDSNSNGGTYIAYLFAHDAGGFGLTGTDNVISCGSIALDGTNYSTVNLGWEPQWVLIKNSTSTSSGAWEICDNMRGMPATSGENYLLANTSAAEGTGGYNLVRPTSTGFSANSSAGTYIYIAIRRGPMKVPTDGTTVFQVYNAADSTNQTTGFPVDMFFDAKKAGNALNTITMSRLIGPALSLVTSSTAAESGGAGDIGTAFQNNTTFKPGIGFDWWSAFGRAPSFFDEVCYTGASISAADTTPVNHNLGVVPELVICKSRYDGTRGWGVWASKGNVAASATGLSLNTTAAALYPSSDFTPYMTATTFTPGLVYNASNQTAYFNTWTYVAYLFATCPGVSKVGSYTGTGATQTISCGFAGGARYVLIKRTDSTGNWYFWDTARGMVAGTDPKLAFNLTTAETNANWVYTTTGGFQIVTTDASVNASGGTYIYLAIA